MAVPQRRTSSMRRDKRRSHHKLNPGSPSLCSHCGNSKTPHRICNHCGYYKGRRIVVVE